VQQALLDGNANASVRVYAIWFKMYPGDARDRWRAAALPDARVAHFWDETRSVGRLYATMLPRIAVRRASESKETVGSVLWDAYLLYGTNARWDTAPPDAISWGSTILLTRDTLARDLRSAISVRH
jgi:hypothetical protein